MQDSNPNRPKSKVRRRAQTLLRMIIEGTSALTGNDFFRALIWRVSEAMQAPYVFVTECPLPGQPIVRTLASLERNVFVDSAQWNVNGTTCEGVLKGTISYLPERLGELYPEYLNKRQSYLGIPFRDSRGTIVGHLAVFDIESTRYTAQEIATLQLIAARAGIEVERKHADEERRKVDAELRSLYEEMRDYNAHLEHQVSLRTQEIERRSHVAESLRDMVIILNSERPLSEILDYMIASATALLGTTSGAIYALQPDQKTLTVQSTRGLPAAYVDTLKISLERSFLGQAIVQRQPLIISNISTAVEQIEIDPQHKAILLENYQTLLAIPMLRPGWYDREDEVYGGIALYYPQLKQFTDDEMQLAVAFAAQAALALENANLRKQIQQAAVIEERGRLARDMHDSVAQSLFSLTLLAEGWRRQVKTGKFDGLEDGLTELGETSRQALKEMRLLVHQMRPSVLEENGLLEALQQRLSLVEKRSGIETHLILTGIEGTELGLSQPVEAELYWIAQEALNNALKHASASAVTIKVARDQQTFVLEICDNGKGFDSALNGQTGGVGLSSIRERAEQLGAWLQLDSQLGHGTTIRLVL